MDVKKTTSFTTIYEAFFTRVTDDMYLEMTELDTVRDLQDILLCAIPRATCHGATVLIAFVYAGVLTSRDEMRNRSNSA